MSNHMIIFLQYSVTQYDLLQKHGVHAAIYIGHKLEKKTINTAMPKMIEVK